MAKGNNIFSSLTSACAWHVLTLILLCSWSTDAQAQKVKARFRPDRILVQPRNEEAARDLLKVQKEKQHKVRKKLPALGLQVIELAPGDDPVAQVEAYKRTGLAVHAEPDYLLYPSLVPNDPLLTNGTLWAMRNTGQSGGKSDADIDAIEAWNSIQSAENIVVAVIDTGVRYTHEDLAANMWRNPGESANGRDDDGNGYVDDIHGMDAIINKGNPLDDDGHGTHVAGTIGGVAGNGTGVAGVAWKVKLMALRFLSHDGGGATSDAIECIDYARKNGADVINASWGGPDYSYFLERAIRNAGSAGIIFVTAAGNELQNNDIYSSYPANYNLPNVISVAASTRMDVLDASYSNYGSETVHLAAPGTGIVSTWHTSDSSYVGLSGTSMATPHVAGAVALLKSAYPSESVSELTQRLLAGTDKLPSLAGKVISGGRLNVANLFPRFWELSLSKQGTGTITASPTAPVYTNGATVTLSAVAAPGSIFTGWTGDLTNSANPVQVAMTADKRIIANFTSIWKVSLTASTGGKVQITPEKPYYLNGETVKITASPEANFAFEGWSGSLNASNMALDLQVRSDLTLRATFAPQSSVEDPKVTSVRLASSGKFVLSLNTAEAQVESSTDLIHWSTETNVTTRQTTTGIEVELPRDGQYRFFRVVP